MKPSESNAAKQGGVNAGLAKKFGQPCNKTTGTGGRKTEAASRPAVNSNIAGKKFFEGPNDYGRGVGPMKGSGGGGTSTGSGVR